MTESTLNPNTSPAATAVVQPVSVVSSEDCAVLNVGFALAVIVSTTVGGKFEKISFHTSITTDPDY